MNTEPGISIIIPHLNDWLRLNKCLTALRNQRTSTPIEIIVVDNGSQTQDLSIQDKYQCILLHESQRGSYRCRNRGIEVARFNALAFTDSDCIPDENWIEEGLKCLHNLPGPGAVGGTIEVFAKNPQKPNGWELWELMTAFQQKNYVEKSHFSATANLFTTKSCIAQVGEFQNELLSGGDREWGQRLHRKGLSLKFCQKAVIKHPARASSQEIWNKINRVSTGHHTIRERDRSSKKDAPSLPKTLLLELGVILRVYLTALKHWRRYKLRWLQVIPVSILVLWFRIIAWTRVRMRK